MTRRPLPLLEPGGRRAPIGPDAVLAGYRAHKGDQHHGTAQPRRCAVCASYTDALTSPTPAPPPPATTTTSPAAQP